MERKQSEFNTSEKNKIIEEEIELRFAGHVDKSEDNRWNEKLPCRTPKKLFIH